MKKKRETAPKILLFLAQNKPASKWEIANTLNKSYGNTHATIQQLLNRHLIKVEYKKPSAKNPKIEVEYYSLTIPGLFEVINAFSAKELDENIDPIARKHADKLPFIFGKWAHFIKHGFRKQAIFNLTTIPMSYKFQDLYSEALERLVTHAFLFSDFRIMHFYDTPVPEFFAVEQAKFHVKELNRITEWLQMLMLDQDLREHVRKEFNWLISDVSQYLKTLKKIRSLTIKD